MSIIPEDAREPNLPAPADGSDATRPAYPWRAPPPPLREVTGARPTAQGRRAGIVTRSVANVIDVGVVIAVLTGTYVAVSAVEFLLNPRTFRFPAPSFGLALVLGAVVQGLYFTVAWAAAGRTYGDQVLGIKVVTERGVKPQLWLATLRALICVTVPIGLLWVVVSRQNRSMQDVVLRTSVVYAWKHEPLRRNR